MRRSMHPRSDSFPCARRGAGHNLTLLAHPSRHGLHVGGDPWDSSTPARRRRKAAAWVRYRPTPLSSTKDVDVDDDDGDDLHEDSGCAFRLIPVRDLPYPHFPSQCAFAALFDERAEDRQAGRGGRKFVRRLRWMRRRRRAACRYHQADWRAIAAAAEAIVRTQGPRPRQVLRAVEESGLGRVERDWLWSLFVDPIAVPPVMDEGDTYGYVNGQHRGCALRFSGYPRAVVSD
jgi:hypothetical protein